MYDAESGLPSPQVAADEAVGPYLRAVFVLPQHSGLTGVTPGQRRGSDVTDDNPAKFPASRERRRELLEVRPRPRIHTVGLHCRAYPAA